MRHLGDFLEDTTVSFLWSTNDGSGASITRATDGTVSVYKDGGVTQSTAGVTDTEDFDSLTGVHLCSIDTSADAFYATGSNYDVVLSGATIDGQSVNAVLASFSIDNRSSSLNATALNNLESAFDGTGVPLGDGYPARQDQIASIAGGLSILETVDTSTVIAGSASGSVSDMNSKNDTRYSVASAAASDIEAIFKITPDNVDAHPVEVHFEGYFDDTNAPFTATARIEAYNFASASWDILTTLTDAAADQDIDLVMVSGHRCDSGQTVETVAVVEGDCLIKVIADDAEITTNDVIYIDYLTVGYVNPGLAVTDILSSGQALDTTLGVLDEVASAVLGDVAHGGTSATLTLDQLETKGVGGTGAIFGGVGNTAFQIGPLSGNGTGLDIFGSGTGRAIEVTQGGTATTTIRLRNTVNGGYVISKESSGGAGDNSVESWDASGIGTALVLITASGVQEIWSQQEVGIGSDGRFNISTDSQAGVTIPTVTDVTNAVTPDNAADTTAILADTNELQTDDVPGLIAALNDPTAAAIADAVLAEDVGDHKATQYSLAWYMNMALSALGYNKVVTDTSDATIKWYDAEAGTLVRTVTWAKSGTERTGTGS